MTNQTNPAFALVCDECEKLSEETTVEEARRNGWSCISACDGHGSTHFGLCPGCNQKMANYDDYLDRIDEGDWF